MITAREFIFYNVVVIVVEVVLFLVSQYALIKRRIRLQKYKDLAAL